MPADSIAETNVAYLTFIIDKIVFRRVYRFRSIERVFSLTRFPEKRKLTQAGQESKKSMRTIARLLAVCFGLYAASAWGQATTALRGAVTDSSGSALVGAQISLTNIETNVGRSTTSGTNGLYSFLEVLPGTYRVTVQAQGFKKYEQSGVTLRVDLPATLNVQMNVGTIAEVITVTGEAPLLNTTDASVGQTMDNLAIQNLPLPAENNVLLLSL